MPVAVSFEWQTAMYKAKWTIRLRLMLLGAAGFWLPDVILHAIRAYNFESRDVRIITVVMPLTFLTTFAAAKWVGKASPPKHVGGSILAGVWLFGGLFMMLGASFWGGGLRSPEGIRWVATSVLLSVLPIYTFIMATYDGALGALLLITAVAFVVWIAQLSGLASRLTNRKPSVAPKPAAPRPTPLGL